MKVSSLLFGVSGIAVVNLSFAAYAKNKLAWPECVEQKLTVAQCYNLINSEIERGHLLENLQVGKYFPVMPVAQGDVMDTSIHPGAETSSEADLYYRVAVPVNYMGQVHGYWGDAQIKYPDQWMGINSGPRDIGPWSCYGMVATQCCDYIKRNVKDRDVNKHYVDCWVQQQEPQPIHIQNRISYCAWEWDKTTSKYIPRVVEDWRQEKVLNFAKDKLTGSFLPEITLLLEAGKVPYKNLDVLVNNLHFHGRAYPGLQHAATELDAWLHVPYTETTVFNLSRWPEMKDILERVKIEILNFAAEPFEIRHTVLIHAGDLQGSFVRHVPRIGIPPGVPECIPSDA